MKLVAVKFSCGPASCVTLKLDVTKGEEKMPVNKKMGIVLSDVHCPFQSNDVCNMALAFIREHKPSIVHLLGDISDFYSVSRFVKDPSRKEDLQSDLNDTKTFLSRIRDAAPASRIIFSEGNHEFRLRRFLAV